MTTTTTTEAVEQLPIDAVIPDPGNRKVTLDAQFVASVRTHGVIQPLLVTQHADQEGAFHLVAGHRRLGAARKLGFDSVPALVRTLSDQEKLELALVDNIQRNDLSVLDEAVAMTRLVELGMSAGRLGKRIGRSASYVRDRLRLMELPVPARRLVDDDTITIEAGLALVALVDHPDILDAVIAEVRTGYANVEWQVSQALRQLEADAKVAEGRAKAEAKGLVVVDHEGYHPTSYVEVGTYGGLDIEAKAHGKEPCHAVVIGPRDGKPSAVCVDRKRHSRKGSSTVKSPTTAGADAEARAEKAARKEAGEHRRAFIASVVAGRVSKADVLGLVLPNYLDDANANERSALSGLLGLEPSDRDRYGAWTEAVDAYTKASDTNLLRACLAFSLIQGEDALGGGYGHDRAERHRAFLAAKGYEPTAYEVAQATEQARRHDEALARKAEFDAEAAIADADSAPGAAGGGDEADPASAEAGDPEEVPVDDAG
ncbi:MAG: ParB/RepB/Spo0J family partition protein [Actinomycetota bacterium]|nr:ParB/RepB/Spo0J family partition protein [Actinomycetota bacterium]